MSSIRSIHTTLEALIEDQTVIVKSLSAEMAKVNTAAQEKLNEARRYVKEMIPTGNDAVYAEITDAVRQAGAQYDFPSMVAAWREEDVKNRDEKAALIAQWGTRAQVASKEAVAREELGIMTEALGDIAPEITMFDATTAKIEQHNQKYPKVQITEASHDDYEDWRFWRWVGYYTFINRAPHHAYLTIGDYTKKYGDYYEDARDIAKLRENQERLTNEAAAKKTELDTITGIGNRMDTLDATYRGPEKIADEVRSRVYDFLLKDDDFTDILFDRSGSTIGRAAALCVAQAQALGSLKNQLAVYHKHAVNTKDSLNAPMDVLSGALFNVGSNTIWYDLTEVENALATVGKRSRDAVREAQSIREEITGYTPVSGYTYRAALSDLVGKTAMTTHSNAQSFDFSGLERKVREEIREYEEEQERQRRAREAAAAAAAAAARAAQREAAEAAERIRSRHTTTTFNNAGSPSRSTGVSMGTTGLSGRQSSVSSVSSGSRGLSGRRN